MAERPRHERYEVDGADVLFEDTWADEDGGANGCVSCGLRLLAGASVCPACGAPVEDCSGSCASCDAKVCVRARRER